MRILGLTIPENQHIDRGLTVLYGIGINKSRKILDLIKIEYSKKTKDLNSY